MTEDEKEEMEYLKKKVKSLEIWQTAVGAGAGLKDAYFKAPEQILGAVVANTHNAEVMKHDHANLGVFKNAVKERGPRADIEDLLRELFGPDWRNE